MIEMTTAPTNRTRATDRVPEDIHYRDTGCHMSPSCLQCMLERCIYDEPEGGYTMRRRARDEEIYRLYRQHTSDIADLALRFGVSRRTVHRAVARQRAAAMAARR